MTRIVLAIAGAAAVLCCEAPSSQAQTYGNAPWCAVIELGQGEVQWQCVYQTVEQCAPNVIAGNRGFCNLNPYNVPLQAAPPASVKHHVRRQVHHHSSQR
jgi:hypothetical protein